MKSYFYVLLIFAYLFLSASSSANEMVLSLKEVVERVFQNDIEGENFLSKKGKLIADFSLKRVRTDQSVVINEFDYYISLDGKDRALTIQIPLGQYYIEKSNKYLNGKIHCSSGGATSGYEVFITDGGGEFKNKYFLLNEWSCGRLGCSYSLVFNENNFSKKCKLMNEQLF